MGWIQKKALLLIGLGCLTALVAACYGAVLWGGQEFAFRDTAHFYGPLYRRVQREWHAGRIPLWEPEENGGSPLLGNPTAAVLYPGKVVYALLPEAWALPVYVVAHTLLAFAAMRALARSWGISPTGATIAALGYTFGAPVLFQHSNLIYLVGAAWAPLGFRAADRWLRLKNRWALAELAAVLALQTLGGDPEAAYLTALAAGGSTLRGLSHRDWIRAARPMLGVAFVVLVWILASPPGTTVRSSSHQAMLGLVWLVGVLIVLGGGRDAAPGMRTGLLGFVGALVLAGALTAAQTLPVAEAILRSTRVDGTGADDLMNFSLQPIQLAGFVWPGVFGTVIRGNRDWLLAVPWADRAAWVPSLYLGGPTLVLALSAAGFRGGPPWRRWLTVVGLASLVAAFGKWGGYLYGLMAAVLPGFAWFRYPMKLLVFTALALSVLAGLGWDRVAEGRPRRAACLATILAVLSLGAWVGVSLFRGPIVAALAASPAAHGVALLGPLDPAGSFAEIRRALGQGTLVQALALGLVLAAVRRPRTAGAALLVLLTMDLILANATYVVVAPRADRDAPPAALAVIRQAEGDWASAEPMRIYRMPQWFPDGWTASPSRRRLREFFLWEYHTLQPFYAIDHGLAYTETNENPIEPGEFAEWFQPFPLRLEAAAAAAFGGEPGQSVLYYPRRAFDLWGTRYFILPAYANGWRSRDRSFLAFLEETDLIYPDEETFRDPERRRRWIATEDVQVRRNRAAYPRAWVVHQVRVLRPETVANAAGRHRGMRQHQLLYQSDRIWRDPSRSVVDLRAIALVESSDPAAFRRLAAPPAGAREAVTIERYEPQRIALHAELAAPGLVVLAERYDPGWRLTIDGARAPVVRVNRLMRGAVVGAGGHTLVFTYDPLSFQIGLAISMAGLAGLAGLVIPSRPWLGRTSRLRHNRR